MPSTLSRFQDDDYYDDRKCRNDEPRKKKFCVVVEDGKRGERGPRGYPGKSIKGDCGDCGDKGDRGPRGYPGKSIKGDKGDRGPRGYPGKSIKGDCGDCGDKGDRGPRGYPGKSIKGDKGDKGDRGPRGYPGKSIKGDKGDCGRDGCDGKDFCGCVVLIKCEKTELEKDTSGVVIPEKCGKRIKIRLPRKAKCPIQFVNYHGCVTLYADDEFYSKCGKKCKLELGCGNFVAIHKSGKWYVQ